MLKIIIRLHLLRFCLDHLNVYDFSDWARTHPGSVSNKLSIKQFAMDDNYALLYPEFHGMKRWNNFKNNLSYLGRLGDVVDFKDFPDSLRSSKIAEIFSLKSSSVEDALICGSPFESGTSNKLFPTSFSITRRPETEFLSLSEFEQQKRSVWVMIASTAPDQLRQRVAW